jgi:hypothetical protein
MLNRTTRALLVGALAIAGLAALATLAFGSHGSGPSHDRKGHYSCRASALRLGSSEPVVANPQQDPCVDDSETLTVLPPDPPFGGTAQARVLNASTDQAPNDLTATGHSHTPPARNDGSTARSSAADVVLNVPAGTGQQYVVRASAVSALATIRCHCNYPSRFFSPVRSAKPQVTGLTIVKPDGSKLVENKTTGDTTKFSTPFFDLYVNEKSSKVTSTGGVATARALRLVIKDPSNGSVVQTIVAAEAIADYTGNPCEFGASTGAVSTTSTDAERHVH